MPACPRREIVDPDRVAYYHCTSRCVRRAFLCGKDFVSGRDYSHRRSWIEDRQQLLASVFAIELCDYALLDNHMHHLLRTRPDIGKCWSDEEVVRRWWRLHPQRFEQKRPAEMTDNDLQMMLSDPGRVAIWRERLCSLSWYMKELKEEIAKRANAEDDVTGHFFASRFSSIEVLDEAALLAASIYIAMNVIRAGMVEKPEEPQHTSVYRRIVSRQQLLTDSVDDPADNDDAWLVPIPLEGEPHNRTAPACRASDQGFLPVNLDQYLTLLDWTGRQVRGDKRGVIPTHLLLLLERLKIFESQWLETVSHFSDSFSRAAGRPASMAEAAARCGRRWLRGSIAAARAFQ